MKQRGQEGVNGLCFHLSPADDEGEDRALVRDVHQLGQVNGGGHRPCPWGQKSRHPAIIFLCSTMFSPPPSGQGIPDDHPPGSKVGSVSSLWELQQSPGGLATEWRHVAAIGIPNCNLQTFSRTPAEEGLTHRELDGYTVSRASSGPATSQWAPWGQPHSMTRVQTNCSLYVEHAYQAGKCPMATTANVQEAG